MDTYAKERTVACAWNLIPSVLVAGLLAGPVIFTIIALGSRFHTNPMPVIFQPLAFVGIQTSMLMSAIIAFVVAAALTMAFVGAMGTIGNRMPPARGRLVWTVTAVLTAIILCLVTDWLPAAFEYDLAIIVTSGMCGWISRSAKPWAVL